jgi:nitrous oxidase accessory protein
MPKTVGPLTITLALAVITCLILFQPTTVRAQPKTIIVPDNYPTIQEAINKAYTSDTIYVKKGYYEGSFNQTLLINKAVYICGEDPSSTILSLDPPLVPMQIFTLEYMGYLSSIQINADNVKISGLSIVTPGGVISAKGNSIQIMDTNTSTGFSIEGSHTTISRNLIKGDLNIDGNNNAVIDNYFEKGLVPSTIDCKGSNNIIANNTLRTKNDADNIKLNIEGAENLIANNLLRTVHLFGSTNIVYKNSIKAVPGDSGIYLSYSSANTICANRITYAESITYQQEGIFLSESYDNVVYANQIEGVFKGVYLQNTDTQPMITNNNTFYHNNFINNQIQAWDYTSSTTNMFDNGNEGNYWSDYHGLDANNDGIGDTPFKPTSLYVYDDVRKVTECSPDNYPLMAPFDVDSFNIEFPEWAITALSQFPTPSPSVPEFSWITTLSLLLATPMVSIIFRKSVSRHRK